MRISDPKASRTVLSIVLSLPSSTSSSVRWLRSIAKASLNSSVVIGLAELTNIRRTFVARA